MASLFLAAPLHQVIAGPSDGAAVLLLHGAKYSSADWESLGTVDLLAEKGYRVIALDLPGYGRSGARRRLDPATFLAEYLDEAGIESVTVVAPSMSGGFAFPLLAGHPQRLDGFVALAPVGAMNHLQGLRRADVPLLALWGANDPVVPLTEGRVLADMLAESELVIIPGGRHAWYFEEGDRFHELLLAFLEGLDSD